MNFLFISPENPLTHKKGGVASYLRKMSKLLISRGHGVTIISLDESYDQTVHEGVVYISVSNILKQYKLSLVGVLINAWRIRKEFKKIVKTEYIDVVQIANLNWIGIFIPDSKNYKKIVRISTSRILYDQYKDSKNSLKSKISELGEVYIMKQSDYVYAPSKLMASYYSKTYDFDVDVIRPPLVSKSTSDSKKNNYNLPTKYFLFFGSVSKRKGIEIVLESFQRTLNTVKDAELVIAGEVKETSIKKTIEKLPSQVRSNIHFLGLVEKPELLDIINGAHVAILPSLVDNLPNTAIECISMGIPIITIEKSSVDELVTETGLGVVIKRNGISEMTDEISKSMSSIWFDENPFNKINCLNHNITKVMEPDKCINIIEKKMSIEK